MADVVRVCLGSEPKTEIFRKVLEFSIRRRTAATVEFTALIGKPWEYAHPFKVGTGFSLRRWMIPEFFNWHGRAIYLDADQLVLGDILDLWRVPDATKVTPGHVAWMTYQPSKFSKTPHPNSSVMVIDCALAKTQPLFHFTQLHAYLTKNTSQTAYAGVMYPNWLKPAPGKLGNEWNGLNYYAAGVTKLLHYTTEPDQPTYKPNHPLAYLWQEELLLAIKAGEIPKAEFEAALAKWNVKEDWRATNGLHPAYRKYLNEFP